MLCKLHYTLPSQREFGLPAVLMACGVQEPDHFLENNNNNEKKKIEFLRMLG